VVRHVDLDDLRGRPEHGTRRHRRREAEAVGEGQEPSHARASNDPHATRGVAQAGRGQRAKQAGEPPVADPANERHLAGLIQPGAQHHVGLLAHERPAQVAEEPWIAGAVGVEEPEQVRVGLPPRLLDGGAVSPIPLEHDELDGVGVAAGALDGAVRRAVAHHGDVYRGHRRALDDLRAGLERSLDDALDALFLVQRGNDDEELHGRRW
jgi:hypothetical protein